MVLEREKDSDEREFDRLLEERRMKILRQGLVKLRAERQADIDSMSVLKGKNIFAGPSNILKDKHLFGMDGRQSMMGGNMFFN